MDYTYADIAKMIDHSLLNPTLTDERAGGRLPAGPGVRRGQRVHHALLPEARGARSSPAARCSRARRSAFPTAATPRRQAGRGASRRWPMAARSWTWSSTSARCSAATGTTSATDIQAVIELTHARAEKLKVIFENCYLEDDQKIRLCEICGELGRRLGEDLDRLRHRRRDRRGPGPDAEALAGARPGEGRRRRARPSTGSSGCGSWAAARRRQPDEGHPRRPEDSPRLGLRSPPPAGRPATQRGFKRCPVVSSGHRAGDCGPGGHPSACPRAITREPALRSSTGPDRPGLEWTGAMLACRRGRSAGCGHKAVSMRTSQAASILALAR